jgi:hypothetical protein
MTPAERRAWARVERRAAELSPELTIALLRALQLLRDRMPERRVEELIRAGRIDEVVDAAAPAELIERVLNPATAVLTAGVLSAGRAAVTQLPPRLRTITIAFGQLDPRVLDAIRALDSTSLRSLIPEIRQVVRDTVAEGITAGVNPRATARQLRGIIGLAPNQAEAVRNFRRALEAGDIAKALGYKLRDRRFDASIRRGNLTSAEIDRMVQRYEERFVAWNAETHARTAALEAQKLAQRLAWEQALESGAIGDGELWKRRHAVQDERTRPHHAAMHREAQPFNTRYSDGTMYPGQGEYNCRCAETYFIKRPGVSA